MKKIKIQFLLLHFFCFTCLTAGYGQEQATAPLQFEVNKVYPYISISPESLQEAQSLLDLNRHYKPDWVRSYLAVEISAVQNGKLKKVIGESDLLNKEQKELIQNADAGTNMKVNIHYIPENNLKENEAKEMDFTFKVDPKIDAVYPGGQEALNEYLKINAINKITNGSFKGFDLSAIQFTINEDGEITNAQLFDSVFQSYKNKAVNDLLLEVIRKMPCWKPAEYANGIKARQQFVLTVGNQESCLVNLLNTIQR